MEDSYWFQQRKTQIAAVQSDLEACQKKMDIKIEEPFFTECNKRYELEHKKKNKSVQRELDSLKNKQLGPKWNMAWSNYNSLMKYKKECEGIQNDLKILKEHQESIVPIIQFLFKIGYISNDNPLTLKNEDLTLKGILATEVNEGHPILMTELYTREILHHLSGEDIVITLSCFQEGECDNLEVIAKIREIAKEFEYIEETIVYPVKDNYWNISTEMMEPIRKWMEGENASVICNEYGLFEGNFIRSVLKMANIVDEWIAMATYCQHIEQINKMLEVRRKIVRGTPDSLYLHL